MTVIVWTLHVLFFGALVTGAAWALDRSSALLGRPRRWIWAGAIMVSAVLPAIIAMPAPLPDFAMPIRTADREAYPTAYAVPAAIVESDSSPWGEPLIAIFQAPASRLSAVLRRVQSATVSILGTRDVGKGLVFGVWLMLSVLVSAILGSSFVALIGARRRWSSVVVEGETVRVTDSLGPAVVGVRKPEIVIPHWALAMEQRVLGLILLHEREHVDARDTLLLASAMLPVLLMPWNPALWYQLHRARECVELDCDRRVLRRGVSARQYGDVLLRVATLCRAHRFPAVAIAESPSLLERRLKEMIDTRQRRPRRRRTLAAAGALLGAFLLVLSCELERPVAIEDEHPEADRNSAAVATHADSAATTLTETDAPPPICGSLAGRQIRCSSDGAPVRDSAGVMLIGDQVMQPGDASFMEAMELFTRAKAVSTQQTKLGSTAAAGQAPVDRARDNAFLIRRSDGTLVPGEFRGPLKLLENYLDLNAGGTIIVNGDVSPRFREHEWPGKEFGDGVVNVHDIYVRLDDGSLRREIFRGSPDLLNLWSEPGGIALSEGTVARLVRVVDARRWR